MTMQTVLWITLTYLVVAVAGVWAGYQFGKGEGEDEGYKLGYHEGSFDERMADDDER